MLDVILLDVITCVKPEKCLGEALVPLRNVFLFDALYYFHMIWRNSSYYDYNTRQNFCYFSNELDVIFCH